MPDKAGEKDLARAKKLLEIYRGDVDDFFKIWPHDKKYFFASDGKSFLAYAVSKQIAVCLGDPVGAPDSIPHLLEEFKEFCRGKQSIAFIQATTKYESAYRASHFQPILIGSDAVIDLDTFCTETVHDKYFRNIVNRFSKQQFVMKSYKPPHSRALIAELKEVSDSWLKLPHKKEWRFLTGRFSTEYLQQLSIHVLQNKEGRAVAFVAELPSYKPGVCTIDLMRHSQSSPSNAMDYLFVCLLTKLRAEGFTAFNLGLSPLDGDPEYEHMQYQLAIRFFKIANRYMGFRGLHQFKSKFHPDWQQRYVWYQPSAFHLIRIGWSVTMLMRKK